MLCVIVPIYNAEQSLKNCIISLLKQSYENIRIILVNDGSEDESLSVCETFKERNDTIIVIDKENGGVNSARLAGLKQAESEYIAFVDADDEIEPDYFRMLMAEMGDADVVAAGDTKEYIAEGKKECEINNIPTGTYSAIESRIFFYDRMLCMKMPFEFGVLPYMCNKIFRKKLLLPLLEKVDKNIFDGEDAAVVYPYLLQCRKIVITDYCGYHYRIHSHSASHRKRDIEYYNESCLYKWLYEWFSQSEYRKMLILQLNRYMLMMLWKRNPEIYIEANEFVFPVEMIPYGSRIIIYGAGDMGYAYMSQIRQNNHCSIVALADAKFVKTEMKDGIRHIAPSEILKEEFDYILIAINSETVSASVYDWLIDKGIAVKKIKTSVIR